MNGFDEVIAAVKQTATGEAISVVHHHIDTAVFARPASLKTATYGDDRSWLNQQQRTTSAADHRFESPSRRARRNSVSFDWL